MPEAKFTWISSPAYVFPNEFRIWSIAKRRQIHTTLMLLVPVMKQWVEANAPWEDRTGDARRLFRVQVDATTLTHVVVFDHGVFYGEYLETHNQMRFAIISRAVDYWGPYIMALIRGMM